MSLSENSEQPYNLQLIDKMCRGNNEQIIKLVKIFVDEITQTIEEINTAFSEKDFSNIKKITHKVKPTLTYFGVAKLEKELLQIDTMLLQDFDVNELAKKLSNFTNLTTEIVKIIKTDFNLTN